LHYLKFKIRPSAQASPSCDFVGIGLLVAPAAVLPAYSPDLNPIGRLWRVLKAEWPSDFIAKTHEEPTARLDEALKWAINRTQQNQNICAIKKTL